MNNAFEKLDEFCNNIHKNYKKLKEYINGGYNKYLYNQYFDENGELTVEAKRQINPKETEDQPISQQLLQQSNLQLSLQSGNQLSSPSPLQHQELDKLQQQTLRSQL